MAVDGAGDWTGAALPGIVQLRGLGHEVVRIEAVTIIAEVRNLHTRRVLAGTGDVGDNMDEKRCLGPPAGRVQVSVFLCKDLGRSLLASEPVPIGETKSLLWYLSIAIIVRRAPPEPAASESLFAFEQAAFLCDDRAAALLPEFDGVIETSARGHFEGEVKGLFR